MATTDTLQLDALLAPIPGDNPAGEDLRDDSSADSLYQQIKTARSNARTAERLRDFGNERGRSSRPNWQLVLNGCGEALAERSKDLEIAAYLIEALIREQGFAGLRDGFRLVRELVERYWDDLYPRPEEDGVAARVAHLAGLNGVGSEGTLIRPILMSPITCGDSGPYSSADFLHAQQLKKLDRKELDRRVAEGSVSMELFLKAVGETPIEFFRQLREDIRQCRTEYDSMCFALEQECGEQAPHSSNIRDALETCLDTIGYIAAEEQPPEVEAARGSELDSNDTDVAAAATTPRLPLHPPRSREEALQTLELVAEYFRHTEPHSPISYAADRLARWGRLPLPELLNELIPDPQARGYVDSLVGMNGTAER